ncbi:unnamed protein product, partial [Tenebrio molitor]
VVNVSIEEGGSRFGYRHRHVLPLWRIAKREIFISYFRASVSFEEMLPESYVVSSI